MMMKQGNNNYILLIQYEIYLFNYHSYLLYTRAYYIILWSVSFSHSISLKGTFGSVHSVIACICLIKARKLEILENINGNYFRIYFVLVSSKMGAHRMLDSQHLFSNHSQLTPRSILNIIELYVLWKERGDNRTVE